MTTIHSETHSLINQAHSLYLKNFPTTTAFERAIFFSWGCTIGDCGFCYMSTQPADKKPTETKRSKESILAEFILAKNLGWDIGFFTGGIGVFTPAELEFMLNAATEIVGEKIWLSVGPLSKPLLQRYLPYIKGVVGSTETINPRLHKMVCPSKPLEPYERMFAAATELQLKKAMTFIVGMGETQQDLPLLINFITRHSIDKIHVYSLIPQEGTMFAQATIPSAEEQAWWIAQLRIAFPALNIQAGIWEDRLEYIPLLLKAGANSLSKFRATALFGTFQAAELERQVQAAGRAFKGTLIALPEVDWNEQINALSFSEELKQKIGVKLFQYLHKMRGPIPLPAQSILGVIS
ncbi:MAG: radical SAM protein [Nanoarchaeota archaeon]